MGSVAPSFEKFDVNETIDLTGEATASTGYAFEKWTSKDATGDPDFPVSDSEEIDFTLKTPTGGTVYTFTAHFKAVAPEAPTDDELADLFKDKISVACVNDQVSHSAKHYVMRRMVSPLELSQKSMAFTQSRQPPMRPTICLSTIRIL